MKLKPALMVIFMCLLVMTICCSCEDMSGIIDDVGNDIGSEDGGDDTEPPKDDTVYLYTVPELLDYENESGQRVVIDLSESTEYDIGKTVMVAGDVNEVVFRGAEGAVYLNMNIVVGDHDGFPITLSFESFTMHGSSKDGAIYCAGGRTVIVRSEAGANTLLGAMGSSALNAPDSTVIFEVSAPMQLIGGKGDDGVDAAGNSGISGGNGGEGCCAVIASQLDKNGQGVLHIVGGSGGKGGKGGEGAIGGAGYNGDGDIWVTLTKPVKSAGTGEKGGRGGKGGDGGNGGAPLNEFCILNVNQGELAMASGAGGTGGEGGTGGTGGKGGEGGDADKGSWLLGVGWTYGSNGGNGGEGGIGGIGGNGGISDISKLNYTKTVQDGAVFTLVASSHGVGGKGGEGGVGGNGGSGGSCDGVVLGNGCQIGGAVCTCGGKGGKGGSGGSGGKGGDGSVGGEGGIGGKGGEGGDHRTTKISCSCVGSSSNGSNGNVGFAGEIIEVINTLEDEEHNTSDGSGLYPGYGTDFPEDTPCHVKDNGVKIYYLSDGTKVYVRPNGRILTIYNSGSWKYLNSDGSAPGNDDTWPENKFTSIAPRPDCETKVVSISERSSIISFENATLEQIREYADMLKMIGFIIDPNENVLGEFFNYSASDSEGWMVVLNYTMGDAHIMIYK